MSQDLAVIGAGPAGVAAANTAARAGLAVAMIDMGTRPGGQYFRHAAGEQAPMLDRRVRWLGGHRVWAIEPEWRIHCLRGDRDDRVETIDARQVVLATGAHDRPLPFPGWDLPGVLTAGGTQALLKGSRVAAGRRVVVAGSGPFLLPVAAALIRKGVRVPGVFEANRPIRLARSLLPAKAVEGAGYALTLFRHRVPFRTRHAVVAAHGEGEVNAVTVASIDPEWRIVPGTERRIDCDTLAVGFGFTPQLELALQVSCATRLDDDDNVVVTVDEGQRTSVPGVLAAGEVSGIGGWELAAAEGEVAGCAAAGVRPTIALLRRRNRLTAFAQALKAAYPVRAGWQSWLDEETLVCRCEEVSLARLREAGRLGADDPRAVKLLSRAAMGWCQGRMCGYAVSALCDGNPVALAHRPIAQPVRLADLARFDTPMEESNE